MDYDHMPYVPQQHHAKIVESWTRAGFTEQEIADKIGCRDIEQLKKHYKMQLGYARKDSYVKVVDMAYEMAMSGEHPSMTKFVLQAEDPNRWVPRDTAPTQHGDGPLQIVLDGEAEEVQEGPLGQEAIEYKPNEVIEVQDPEPAFCTAET